MGWRNMFVKRLLRLNSLAIILSAGIMIGCGPSAEEQAATSVALTAAAATSTRTVTPTQTPTPTSTPTPTPTPIPYDLSVLVAGEENAPILGATVVLAEVEGDDDTQKTDNVGQAFWYDLPGETINLSISAQGYFPLDTTESIKRGINQVSVGLERDPHGLLPSEACGPGEQLLYIEDFQDGEAQGWQEIQFRTQGWDLGPHPDSQGNLVIIRPANIDSGSTLHDREFDSAVWRVRFMPVGKPTFNFNWLFKADSYEVEGETVEWSSYQVWFDPPGNRVFRAQSPLSTVGLQDIVRTMRSGEWHQIEISTFQGLLEVWIDGRRFLHYNDPRPLPEGALSIGAGWDSSPDDPSIVYFDDISVCELSAPYVPMPTPES